MTAKRAKPVSAEELMDSLAADPAYQEVRRNIEQQQEANRETYALAARPIIEDLNAIGFRVRSMQELRTSGKYAAAIPVLVKWLPQITVQHVRLDLIHTLSVPWAKEAIPTLLSEYEKADPQTDGGIKWAIGSALEVLCHEDILEDLVRLATDRRNGKSREMLVLALAKIRCEEARTVLTQLLADEEVAGHAVTAMRKGRMKVDQELVRPFLEHQMAWVRKEAKLLIRLQT